MRRKERKSQSVLEVLVGKTVVDQQHVVHVVKRKKNTYLAAKYQLECGAGLYFPYVEKSKLNEENEKGKAKAEEQHLNIVK